MPHRTMYRKVVGAFTDQKFLSWGTALLMFVGIVVGGYNFMVTKFALAADVARQFSSLDVSLKTADWNRLRAEETGYLRMPKPLNPAVANRLREVQDALQKLSKELGIPYTREK